MCAKTGRPKSDNPKHKIIAARLDKETLDQLDELMRQTGQSLSEIIRRGIRIQYQNVKK